MGRSWAVLLVALLSSCAVGQAGPTPTPSLIPTVTSPSLTPEATAPLVFAVHHSRGELELSTAQAEALRAGRLSWPDLGQPGGALTVVDLPPIEAVDRITRDRDAVAIVPATAVDERVRVARVDGIHPLREPEAYAMQTASPDTTTPAITTVTIVGDIMLGRRVGQAYADSPEAPFEPFAERLAGADVTVGNFEATLSDNGRPTQGGDSFFADPRMLDGLRAVGVDGVSLANNHLGDYGTTAMRETFAAFDRAGIARFGAGTDLAAARAPWVVEHDGTTIAFIGTESIGETPAATDTAPGTNRLSMPPRTGPFDTVALDRIADDIRAAKDRVDTVIVVPHWGTQYTHAPEPSQRRAAERFAEAGADLVIGGHPHWVQGWEAYDHTTVVHSLGNFIFDMQFSRQVQEGVFVEIVVWDGTVKAVEPVPYVIRDHVPQPAPPADAMRILDDLRSTSTGPYAG
jgi:poly-gamma-glutamate capsule biosynthesis protein CapA/YwtB (metallophosphatase superfamily)